MDKSIHSPEYSVFLNVFKAVRGRAGLTQASLAERVGESQSFISKCERGERRIDVIELRTFCSVFGVSIGEFVRRLEVEIRKRQRREAKRSSTTRAKKATEY
jgi:transcriptional regulator with XRE-family HTH domain